MSLAAVKVEDVTGPRAATDGGMRDGPLRCVLMDDSRFDRRYLRNIAANSRYSIDFVETSSIAETKAVLESREADFVVFDNLLPDGSGVEYAQQISRDARMNGVPVIVTTGVSSEDVAVKALRAGVADYLVKEGLSTEAFDAAVENALKRSRQPSADDAAKLSNLQAENATLRRIALRNMRILKTQILPLLSFAWRMLKGEQISDEERPDYVSALTKMTRKVNGLVDDTVIVSATHRVNDVPGPVDLGAVLQEIIQDESGEVAASHAHITVGPLPVIEARATQIRMLFEELLVSAVRSCPSGQTPRIEFGAGVERSGNPVIWMVETGVELSLRKQAIAAKSDLLAGETGQGELLRDAYSWSLCERLVERNGGQFRIAETTAAGSKIMMRFPKARLVTSEEPETAA